MFIVASSLLHKEVSAPHLSQMWGKTELDLALFIAEHLPLPVVQYSYNVHILYWLWLYFHLFSYIGNIVIYLSSISYHKAFAASAEGSNPQPSAFIESFVGYTDSNHFCSLAYQHRMRFIYRLWWSYCLLFQLFPHTYTMSYFFICSAC